VRVNIAIANFKTHVMPLYSFILNIFASGIENWILPLSATAFRMLAYRSTWPFALIAHCSRDTENGQRTSLLCILLSMLERIEYYPQDT
jgi:hypothetical protein